jgi:hypothetical protein
MSFLCNILYQYIFSESHKSQAFLMRASIRKL